MNNRILPAVKCKHSIEFASFRECFFLQGLESPLFFIPNRIRILFKNKQKNSAREGAREWQRA